MAMSAPVTVVVPNAGANASFTVTGTILKHPAVDDDESTLNINESAVKGANIYLKDGDTVVKHAGTDKDGVFTIYNVSALAGDEPYTIEPVKYGYTFSDKANAANATISVTSTTATGRDFSAHTAW
jgi:hypothetical protein